MKFVHLITVSVVAGWSESESDADAAARFYYDIGSRRGRIGSRCSCDHHQDSGYRDRPGPQS